WFDARDSPGKLVQYRLFQHGRREPDMMQTPHEHKTFGHLGDAWQQHRNDGYAGVHALLHERPDLQGLPAPQPFRADEHCGRAYLPDHRLDHILEPSSWRDLLDVDPRVDAALPQLPADIQDERLVCGVVRHEHVELTPFDLCLEYLRRLRVRRPRHLWVW